MSGPLDRAQVARSLQHSALLAGLVGTGLLVWPGLPTPFSTPKTLVLLFAALLGLASVLVSPEKPTGSNAARTGALLWAGSTGLVAALAGATTSTGLALEAAVALWLVACVWRPPERGAAIRIAALTGTVVAAIALAQALGADVFGWLGYRGNHPGARMRVVSTLGNPDFVAGYLGATAWLALAQLLSSAPRRARLAWAVAFFVQLAALAVTRSWASVFAFAAAALVFLVRAHAGRRTLAVLVVSACALAIGVRGRSLDRSLAGRAYLWKISAAHLLDAPWVGSGPGSFAVLWPGWEAEHVAAKGEDRAFFGRQVHAHDDFLEWLLELGGPVGVLRIALVLLALGLAIRSAREPLTAAVAAAAVSLAMRAGADFPFHRPAELCLFVVLTSLSLRSPR